MKSITVSVVIPAYNEEKLLGRCLESLHNQHLAPHEIIVVDNNSSDRTAEIAAQYGAIVVSEKRQGIAWARDAGFDRASGDIIARCDADCVAPPTWIETITRYYEKQAPDDWRAITGMGRYTMRFLLGGRAVGAIITTGYNVGNRLMLGSVALFGSCMAFPRIWWDDIKNEVCKDSTIVHEDIDLTAHLLNKGRHVHRLPRFYTHIDTRSLREPFKKTVWRFKIWPESTRRHRRIKDLSTR